jgi:dienelactone hydrolase
MQPARRAVRAGAAAVMAVAVLAAGCSSGMPAAAPPPYQHTGPDAVGVTTLDLGSAGPVFGERSATVYYPADPARAAGYPRFSYTEASTLPASLQGILPAKYNTTTTVDAYVNPPASPKGPYPIVLFSHGYGGERLYYSNLLTGIASWGYVVVSADYLERGLAAQALGSKIKDTPAMDSAVLESSLHAVENASASTNSVLHGIANPHKVAAAGHSAGGQTAFDALDSPAVTTAIGWAPVGPAGKPAHKPVMLIGAEGDQVVPPASVRSTYDSYPGPKSLIEISGEGHNTYTDICVGIRAGGGLISYAEASHLVSPKLAKLGLNGCQMSDLPPQQFWPVVQFYTVLQLKNQFGGQTTATIPSPAAGQFPGFTVTVTQSN